MEKKINAEKLQALLDNEELMKKLSAESATPKDYAEVFKTAGIELTEEEAKALKDEVARIVADPEKALNDADLENVSGGNPYFGLGTSVSGIGFYIASCVVKDPKTKSNLRTAGNICTALSIGNALIDDINRRNRFSSLEKQARDALKAADELEQKNKEMRKTLEDLRKS